MSRPRKLLTLSSDAKLADRTAGLHAAPPPKDSEPREELSSGRETNDSKAGRGKEILGSPFPADVVAKVRQDLGDAQRSRASMETKLQNITQELNQLKLQAALSNKRISELTKEKAMLITGMRDRDEELRGKTKLLEDVHDETVSLTLQLNMAEEQSQKLQRENKELVDRWMARMGQEADAMNDESKFT